MNSKIRVLGIAPYENMRTLMLSVAEEFEDIDLTVFVGDMQQGVEMALRNFHNDYDLIISRGGTATMLRANLDLPVVEIHISAFDIMRAMRLASNVSNHYAVVGFPNITASAENLRQLMQAEMEIHTVHNAEDANQILTRIQNSGERTIMCDMIAYTTARQMGMDVLLITSGTDAIREAYRDAMRLYRNYRRLQEENRFLRSLVWNQLQHTVVFNDSGELFFSTVPDNRAAIVEFLREEGSRSEIKQRHILKQIKNVIYSIRMSPEEFGGREYITYYFSESRVSAPDIQRGIRYVSAWEAQEEFSNSIYSVSNLIRDLHPQIQRINAGNQPLLICGEDGTCKQQVANYIYLTSQRKNRPMVIIDCFMLTDKGWNYLMDHHNSPFAQSDCTILLKNVDVLTVPRRRQLIANMIAMEICKRNRMIFSCVCRNGEFITEAGKDFLNSLSLMNLYLPPLRDRLTNLQAVSNLYLSHLNTDMEKQILGMEPDALNKLKEYEWSHNYTQLQRVLKELVLMATGGYISAQDVEDVLMREKTMTSGNEQVEDQGKPLDLRMTLSDLNKEIAKRVLQEEHGNQTRTAQRLGIGRTTLWRLLNDHP